MSRLLMYSVCCVALAACGNISRAQHDGGTGQHDDASMRDGGGGADSFVTADAMPQLPPTPAREVIGGGGRMTGATFTLDVEVGMPMPPQKTSAAIHTIQTNTAVQQ